MSVWDNYECDGQISIYDLPEFTTIDNHLKSCAPYDVYTYSFTKAEVDHINRALQRYDLVKEIRNLLGESK